MAKLIDGPAAFGAPGRPSTWAPADKLAVGTAHSASSRIWFTVWRGALTEIYYPTVDRPQLRQLEFAVEKDSRILRETADFSTTIEPLEETLGACLRLETADRQVVIEKQVITDPLLPAVLVRAKVHGANRLFVLAEPHLEVAGAENNGKVAELSGKRALVAERNGRWLAIQPNIGFSRASAGYLGASDGWTDLDNGRMDWEFSHADHGNVVLTGEIELAPDGEFVLAVAFGESFDHACMVVLQALGLEYDQKRSLFVNQWHKAHESRAPLEKAACDSGRLYRTSFDVLIAHEDKTYQGAFIASMSIPWGDCIQDPRGAGGYHLVWTRDMVQASSALLAAGEKRTALRSLTYLSASQNPNGAFPQNFWIDGRQYWTGIQFDEIAYPMLLARKLQDAGALESFDPYPTLIAAAAYLVEQGPVTGEERWEESSGLSPSTLAVIIAGIVCTAAFARERGHGNTAQFLEEYADCLRDHLERWTVTHAGALHPDIRTYIIRLNPIEQGRAPEPGYLEQAEITLPARVPGETSQYPARDIVDAGFLQLVRLGILRADDPLIEASIRVADAVLRVDTPFGPCWRRYNHDRYGQRDDGTCFREWGTGRAWPLLTGERGHYELARGRDPKPYVRAMEAFANEGRLIPEQIWDDPDHEPRGMRFGGPTGSAMPLLWAHSEYVKLLRSIRDGKCFDLVPEVAERYLARPLPKRPLFEIWTFRFPTPVAGRGQKVRIYARGRFRLHWSADNWASVQDTDASDSGIGIWFADVQIGDKQTLPLRFTFFWMDQNRWQGADYSIRIE